MGSLRQYRSPRRHWPDPTRLAPTEAVLAVRSFNTTCRDRLPRGSRSGRPQSAGRGDQPRERDARTLFCDTQCSGMSPELLVIVCALMDPFPIRWCLLEDADDEALLRALTYAHTVNDGRLVERPRRGVPKNRRRDSAGTHRAHTRGARCAVQDGERSPNESIAVDPEAALAVVADDANWDFPAESGRDVRYALRLTASGEQEAQRLFGSR